MTATAQHSRITIGTWCIKTVEYIITGSPQYLTQEQLGLFESFLNAYLFFDKICLPTTLQDSQFLKNLDPNSEIFLYHNYFESRITNNINKDRLGSNTKIALSFKNLKNLKTNNRVWESQLNYSNLTITPELMLEDFYVQQKISFENNAAMMSTLSTLQVHPLNMMDLTSFYKHLKKTKYTNLTTEDDLNSFGTFLVEVPKNELSVNLKIPSVLDIFNSDFDFENSRDSLIKMRKKTTSLRNDLTSFWADFERDNFFDDDDDSMSKKIESDWEQNVQKSFNALNYFHLNFSKSFGTTANIATDFKINKFFSHYAKERFSSLRLICSKEYLIREDVLPILEKLKITEFIPYDPRNLPKQSANQMDIRQVTNPSIATVLTSLVIPEVQFQPQDIDQDEVKDFCKNNPQYIYMICTRPKITVEKNVQIRNGSELGITFCFHKKEDVTKSTIWSELPANYQIQDIEYPFTQLKFRSPDGKMFTYLASFTYQQTNFSILNKKNMDEPFEVTNEESMYLQNTDLKVEYIGQSYDPTGNRSVLDRIKNHETLLQISSDTLSTNPHLEIWIVLLAIKEQHISTNFIPDSNTSKSELKHLSGQFQKPPIIDLETQINFTEACLINYFKPSYNENFKEHFPSREHKSYVNCYSNLADFYCLELQTHEVIGCRIFSESIKPDFYNYKILQFNHFKDRKKFFGDL